MFANQPIQLIYFDPRYGGMWRMHAMQCIQICPLNTILFSQMQYFIWLDIRLSYFEQFRTTHFQQNCRVLGW